MQEDLKQRVLQSIADEAKSTLRVLGAFPELIDRKGASLFINGLLKDRLVKRYDNGYWHITNYGKEALQAVKLPDVPVFCKTPGAELEIDLDLDQAPVVPEATTATDTANTEPEVRGPKVVATITSPATTGPETIWDSLSTVAEQVPDSASLTIEQGKVIAQLSGHYFSLEEDGDFEAFCKMADRLVSTE